jgi:hypothetical protein
MILAYHRMMLNVYVLLAQAIEAVVKAARRIRRRAVIQAARHSSEYWRRA